MPFKSCVFFFILTIGLLGCTARQLPLIGSGASTSTGNPSPGSSLPSGGGPTTPNPPSPQVAGAPVIFYTDLTSGPNTGGENNNGAIVSIYGSGFGSSRDTASSVTVGGGAVADYLVWTNNKIAVSIGGRARTGNIVVQTSKGSSNAVLFTVRSGNIYCVAVAGNDANSGHFPDQCWATILNMKKKVSAGDIVYAKDGVKQITVDPDSTVFGKTADYAAFMINFGATAAAPLALVAYPGATVTIGAGNIAFGIFNPNISGNFSHWVLAGLTIRGQSGIEPNAGDYRFIANDISCTGSSGYSCAGGSGTGYYFYGNHFHDVGQSCGSNPNTCKLYHTIYFGVVNQVDLGWNILDPDPKHTGVAGCRALQFHTADGSNLNDFDLHVHDNVIRNAICDGINFTSVDPDSGPVEAYNNLIYHVGTGPDPAGVQSNYSCVYTTSNRVPTGAVELYNNTMYDCGSHGGGSAGALAATINTRLRNNIFYQLSSESFLTQACNNVMGSNNIWFGVAAPACASLAASLTRDPLFTNLAAFDFHLQSGSSAIDAGTSVPTLLTDFDGYARPWGNAFDIGAFERPLSP